MNTTMVRVTQTTLKKLQQVKKANGAKSYDQLISDLLDLDIGMKVFSKTIAEIEEEPICGTDVSK